MLERIAIAQMCSGTDPAQNANTLNKHIEEAAAEGADILFTPEMTGLLDRNRKRATENICLEQDDLTLSMAREGAAKANIWVSLGSLALKSDEEDEIKWINRSFLIDPNGEIAARYDKIHLFDVDLETGESWRESSVYRGGDVAVTVRALGAVFGLSICYDLRFSGLYQALSSAGANILTVPSAFTVPTGKAHWEVLLRARAIESASFVVAAAQCGHHEDGRETYGHSMVISPWGEILLEMGAQIGVSVCDIDLGLIEQARTQVPVLANRRSFAPPENFE